jgi:hypothetical protein
LSVTIFSTYHMFVTECKILTFVENEKGIIL